MWYEQNKPLQAVRYWPKIMNIIYPVTGKPIVVNSLNMYTAMHYGLTHVSVQGYGGG